MLTALHRLTRTTLERPRPLNVQAMQTYHLLAAALWGALDDPELHARLAAAQWRAHLRYLRRAVNRPCVRCGKPAHYWTEEIPDPLCHTCHGEVGQKGA